MKALLQLQGKLVMKIPANLLAAFKKIMNISPSEYRKTFCINRIVHFYMYL